MQFWPGFVKYLNWFCHILFLPTFAAGVCSSIHENLLPFFPLSLAAFFKGTSNW